MALLQIGDASSPIATASGAATQDLVRDTTSRSVDMRSTLLLNTKTNDGGRMRVYTELDAGVNIGDTVYIIGGGLDVFSQYQNASKLSDIFTNTEWQGYKVLSFDRVANAITLDIPFDASKVVSPDGTYAVLCKNAFLNGDFRKGTWVEGSFGQLGSPAENAKFGDASKRSPDNPDAVWQQGVWQNGEMRAGRFDSRTDVNKRKAYKIRLQGNERMPVTVGLNNDGIGYNVWLNGLWGTRLQDAGDATWKNGVFMGGEFINGTFAGGEMRSILNRVTWHSGEWQNGKAFNIDWLDGNWSTGLWSGLGFGIDTAYIYTDTTGNMTLVALAPSAVADMFKPNEWCYVNNGLNLAEVPIIESDVFRYSTTPPATHTPDAPPSGYRHMFFNMGKYRALTTTTRATGGYQGNSLSTIGVIGGPSVIGEDTGGDQVPINLGGGTTVYYIPITELASGVMRINYASFRKGTWKDGGFNSGIFGKPATDTTLVDSTTPLDNDVIWMNGTFGDGVFLRAGWYGGNFGGLKRLARWKDGFWQNGNMYYGIWEGGIWVSGNAYNTNFINRHTLFYSGKFESGITSGIDWANVNWRSGDWQGDPRPPTQSLNYDFAYNNVNKQTSTTITKDWNNLQLELSRVNGLMRVAVFKLPSADVPGTFIKPDVGDILHLKMEVLNGPNLFQLSIFNRPRIHQVFHKLSESDVLAIRAANDGTLDEDTYMYIPSYFGIIYRNRSAIRVTATIYHQPPPPPNYITDMAITLELGYSRDGGATIDYYTDGLNGEVEDVADGAAYYLFFKARPTKWVGNGNRILSYALTDVNIVSGQQSYYLGNLPDDNANDPFNYEWPAGRGNPMYFPVYGSNGQVNVILSQGSGYLAKVVTDFNPYIGFRTRLAYTGQWRTVIGINPGGGNTATI